MTTRVSVLAIRRIYSIDKKFQATKDFHKLLKPFFSRLFLVSRNTYLIEGVAVTLIF